MAEEVERTGLGWDSDEPEKVEMYHPDLDETVYVWEKAVHVLKKSGWRRRDAEEADTDLEPEDRSIEFEPREPAEPEAEKE